MSKHIAVGIDIGTYQTRVVVTESSREGERELPRVIGVGSAESRGLRNGYILNRSDAVKSLRQAVDRASIASGFAVTRAIVSIGGVGLSCVISTGSVVTSRADSEITELDVKKAVDMSSDEIPKALSLNRKILHTVPLQFKVDGRSVLGKPEGLKGSKLEVRTLFITCLEHHINDLLETFAEAGVEVEEHVASPMAASLVTLTKQQKKAGVVLADIGSETVSIVVFENGLPISLEVFPHGSDDITNDIALGLRVPLEEAEDIKHGALVGGNFSRKKLDEIVEARLSDIFDLIDAHLKKLGRSGLLPAGIVFTGGGSAIEAVNDRAKDTLKLPSRVASVSFGDNIRGQIKDASWSVAYGLCVLGLEDSEEYDDTTSGRSLIKRLLKNTGKLLRQFLP